MSTNAREFWEQERRDSEKLLASNLRRQAFDIQKARAEGACLGRALGLESDALQLALTGFVSEAREYFLVIRELALGALAINDRYTFQDPDGNNLFGRYTANKLISTATWATGGAERQSFLIDAIQMLRNAVEADAKGAGDRFPSGEPRIQAQMTLHFAQLEQWTATGDAAYVKTSSRPGASFWATMVARIEAVANAKKTSLPADIERARRTFDPWYLALVDVTKHGRTYSPHLTADDVIGITEVRCRDLYDIHDPWTAILSIRTPNLGHA